MAKKQIWIDNTRPPTNYIWAKTDATGKILGVYQWNGTTWIKIASTGIGNVAPEGDGTITAITLDGDSIQLYYSMSPNPGTVAVRTDTGTLLAATPSGSEPQELVTVEMLTWG